MRKSVSQILLDKDKDRNETIEWINSASISELRDFMHSLGYLDPWFGRAQNALSIKLAEAAKEPHWSVTPNFWFTVISAVAAIVAAWFAWRADFREQQREHTGAASDLPAAQALSPSPSSPSNSSALKP